MSCYLQTCLNHYNNNPERVVNALVDNTVPKELAFEESNVSVPSSNIFNEDEIPFISKDASILGHRSNIYDNDEFDIFNQENIDLTRIHRGKKFVNIFYIMIFMLLFSEHEMHQKILMINLIQKA